MADEEQKKNHDSRSWLPVFLSAFFGILGIVVGAFLNQSLTAQIQKEKSLSDLRTSIYSDFFQGQALHQQALVLDPTVTSDESKNLEAQYQLMVKKARFQMGIYASKPVVDSLVTYFRAQNPGSSCGPKRDAFSDVQVYQQMRSEVFGTDPNQRISDDDLYFLLFNCNLPK